MYVWKNAQMTRTNKRIKQGNTRKIKKYIYNNNNTTVVPEGVIPKYLYTIHVYKQYTFTGIHINMNQHCWL